MPHCWKSHALALIIHLLFHSHFQLREANVNILSNLVLYRKAQKKSSAMHALAGFAIGGDMMKKQISEERKKQEHSVTVDIGKTNTGM